MLSLEGFWWPCPLKVGNREDSLKKNTKSYIYIFSMSPVTGLKVIAFDLISRLTFLNYEKSESDDFILALARLEAVIENRLS